MNNKTDYLIIGAGVVGLSMALALRKAFPSSRIVIIEKEKDIAAHASGRNSGVLHAGFYYSADSLKARFTVEGNRAMKEFCHVRGIAVNECGKLVVAQNPEELKILYELESRGKRNGSNIAMINESQAERIEPNVRTYQHALYSPDTATVDPAEVCRGIMNRLQELDISINLSTKYLGHASATVKTDKGDFTAFKVINCAGLYADKIAQDYGFGRKFTMVPFKGLYLKYTKNNTDVRVHIYPVPNLKNPFLGVHFTKTVDGGIKIGPTAIPAFWRENYGGLENFQWQEFLEIIYQEARLFLANSFHFRDLAIEEMRKYRRRYFIGLAEKLVKTLDPAGFSEFTKPGIRAQLLDKATLRLVEDFVVEGDSHSIHVLNAVSPALTCAFPFSEFVVKKFINVD